MKSETFACGKVILIIAIAFLVFSTLMAALANSDSVFDATLINLTDSSKMKLEIGFWEISIEIRDENGSIDFQSQTNVQGICSAFFVNDFSFFASAIFGKIQITLDK